MWKHVIIEHVNQESVDAFETLAARLTVHMQQRGWVLYRAWRTRPGEVDEPPLLELGVLKRATNGSGRLTIFEADFPDRASLDAQLHAMRHDPEVVNITIAAAALVDPIATKSFIYEAWYASDDNMAAARALRRGRALDPSHLQAVLAQARGRARRARVVPSRARLVRVPA